MSHEGYRHCVSLSIRFADLDTLHHVNNARYLTYIEQARITYMHDLDLWNAQRTVRGIILAKVTLDFKLPLKLEDRTAQVWTRISRLGNKSFDMDHLITREADNAIAAMGVLTLVAFDYETENTISIPEEWRQKIIAFEPTLQSAGQN